MEVDVLKVREEVQPEQPINIKAIKSPNYSYFQIGQLLVLGSNGGQPISIRPHRGVQHAVVEKGSFDARANG